MPIFGDWQQWAFKPAAVAACVLVLAGCNTTGSSFDTSALRFIVPGQTTLAEASSLLGASPINTYQQQDGSLMARWAHNASLMTDAIYFNQELWLDFGPDGRFVRINKSVNIPRANMYKDGHVVNTVQPPAATQYAAPQLAPTVTTVPATPVPAPAPAPAIMYKPAVSYPLPQ
ncbi:MAG TPA: hypothetical protein VL001_12615 [Candidimonas sp.]|nr:hypothetical protein [Candidimonas sp.]